MQKIKYFPIATIAVILSAFLLLPTNVFANKYAASSISEELKKDANSVFRVNNRDYIFHGPNSYTERIETVVTILKEAGNDFGYLFIPYDSHSRARFIEGEIIDESGRIIKKIRQKDLSDYSAMQGFSLYEDNRVLTYDPKIYQYPYTVRYVYEITYRRGMYYSNTFFPVESFNSSAENATLSILFPENLTVKYEEFNIDKGLKTKTSDKNYIQWQWKFKNIPAVKHEHLAPSLREISYAIMFACNEFAFDSYQGSNSSWLDYGKWIWEMNKGRDKLPQATIDMLRNMVKDIDDDKEKVKAIYQYLQSRTRYVNIVLGIGGMQPFDAQTVDRNGYGDCKALSNYMVAMLKEVGIESHYTLVRAGSQRRDYRFSPDFVASQFNHVIVCVPLNGDTIYLECTSQVNPFGHQGDFTDNRYVLIIREDGGHLRRTPAIPITENALNGSALVKLDAQGNGNANVTMTFGGHFFSPLNAASRQNEEDQKKWLYSRDYLPNSVLEKHSIQIDNSRPAIARLEMQALLKTYANVSRNRIFIPVNLLSASKSTPPRIRNRVHPFELAFERSYCDTITYIVPEGFVVESIPQNTVLESEFGKYVSTIVVEGNVVKYTMYYESKSGRFPPEKYPEYFEFWQSIVRADNQNVTFLKE